MSAAGSSSTTSTVVTDPSGSSRFSIRPSTNRVSTTSTVAPTATT